MLNDKEKTLLCRLISNELQCLTPHWNWGELSAVDFVFVFVCECGWNGTNLIITLDPKCAIVHAADRLHSYCEPSPFVPVNWKKLLDISIDVFFLIQLFVLSDGFIFQFGYAILINSLHCIQCDFRFLAHLKIRHYAQCYRCYIQRICYKINDIPHIVHIFLQANVPQLLHFAPY